MSTSFGNKEFNMFTRLLSVRFVSPGDTYELHADDRYERKKIRRYDRGAQTFLLSREENSSWL